MPRRRSLFKTPFFKFKINQKTTLNIFGFLFIAAGVILLVSFINLLSPSDDSGRILKKINNLIVERFGSLAIIIPFIFIIISGHFFNSKKLKFVKYNLTGGIILIFFSLIGILQSGTFGKVIFENLVLDFTLFGCLVILGLLFLIGLILFFDTSVDVFVLFIFKLIKAVFSFLKQYAFRQMLSPAVKKNGKEAREPLRKENDFIIDRKIDEKNKSIIPAMPSTMAVSQNPKDIIMKPMTPQGARSTWVYPPLNLLTELKQEEADRGDVNEIATTIERTLDSFGLRAKVSEVNRGPAVTQYALSITQGTKLSKITSLSNDLALAIAAPTGTVRIEAPIPGRSLVGIEIPNRRPEIVTLRKMFAAPVFLKNNDPLLIPLGLDVSGEPQAASISKMPHILVAGTTGSGKSVLLNAWICTFLYRTKPDDLRLILVDPKRVEMTLYNGIPHLLTEVIVDPDKIISALKWTVKEMENRYKEFAKVGARNLDGFNATPGVIKKPYILFVIDELADLMIFAPGDAEELITRIAQMARATGIHLILATQRPSVDVITGLMKANIPCRVAFNVSSMIDSRVIIDTPGAEKLLGKGDMLFLPPDQAKPRRIQGPFITEKEVNQIVRFLRSQVTEVHYTEEVTQQANEFVTTGPMVGSSINAEKDPLFKQALAIISSDGKASASLLQRRLSIGYARAARLLDQLEAAGYVGPSEGSKPRAIIKRQSATEISSENPTDII